MPLRALHDLQEVIRGARPVQQQLWSSCTARPPQFNWQQECRNYQLGTHLPNKTPTEPAPSRMHKTMAMWLMWQAERAEEPLLVSIGPYGYMA